jgi:hypothetical protein
MVDTPGRPGGGTSDAVAGRCGKGGNVQAGNRNVGSED